jgi:Spy/CpxP family protein refolding chaperone
MEKKSLTRITWGIGAASVLTLGLVVAMPQIGASQDATQTQSEQGGQNAQGPKGQRERGARPGGGPREGGAALRGISGDLTDAQREQITSIQQRHAEQMKPLAERARSAREAVNAAAMSGNMANLQQLSSEVGKAETELTLAQAQEQAEIYKVLTPEQKEKLAAARKQRSGGQRAETQQRRPQ